MPSFSSIIVMFEDLIQSIVQENCEYSQHGLKLLHVLKSTLRLRLVGLEVSKNQLFLDEVELKFL